MLPEQHLMKGVADRQNSRHLSKLIENPVGMTVKSLHDFEKKSEGFVPLGPLLL